MLSAIIEDIPQADGRRRITERHADAIGRIHTTSYIVSDGFDAETAAIARGAILEQKLVEQEAENSTSRLEDGENPLDMNFDYCTPKQAAERLIRFGMRSRDPQILLALKPLIEYLKANFTNQQIANYLNVTVEQLGRINTRYNAIIAQETFLNGDAAAVEGIE